MPAWDDSAKGSLVSRSGIWCQAPPNWTQPRGLNHTELWIIKNYELPESPCVNIIIYVLSEMRTGHPEEEVLDYLSGWALISIPWKPNLRCPGEVMYLPGSLHTGIPHVPKTSPHPEVCTNQKTQSTSSAMHGLSLHTSGKGQETIQSADSVAKAGSCCWFVISQVCLLKKKEFVLLE